MDDIASDTGISKKTLYQYCKDKKELVENAIETILNKNDCDNASTKRNAKNAIEESFVMIEQSADLFKTINPLVLYDLKKYYPAAYEKFIQYKNNELYNKLKENVEWGIADGLFRADLNIEVAVHYRLESILIAFLPDFQSKVKISLAEIYSELFDLFTFGIATKKGYELFIKMKTKEKKNNIHAHN